MCVNFADVPHVSDLVVFVVRLHHINTPVTKHHPRRVCSGANCKMPGASLAALQMYSLGRRRSNENGQRNSSASFSQVYADGACVPIEKFYSHESQESERQTSQLTSIPAIFARILQVG